MLCFPPSFCICSSSSCCRGFFNVTIHDIFCIDIQISTELWVDLDEIHQLFIHAAYYIQCFASPPSRLSLDYRGINKCTKAFLLFPQKCFHTLSELANYDAKKDQAVVFFTQSEKQIPVGIPYCCFGTKRKMPSHETDRKM